MASGPGMKKLQRMRSVSSSSVLPAWVAVHYTEGQLSAMSVIACVAKRDGRCDLASARIAKLAGVSVSTVRAAINVARDEGHIAVKSRQADGETNIITMVRGVV